MMRRSSRSPTPTRSTRSTPVDEPKSPLRQVPNDKVKIYVRLRPSLNEEELNDNLSVCDQNTIQIVKSDLDTTYMKFDKIFTPKLRQSDIFHNIDTSIQRFLQGENHSFFAYGQTGAGKTYTMIGDFDESSAYIQSPFLASEHRGILPRSLEKIVNHLRTHQRKSSLQASFFEVYNEKVYDLLDPRPSSKKEGLGLRENKDGGNQIVDLLKFEIRSVEDALQCLKVGLKNRVIGCSHANTKSSRSHAIFQLVLIQDDEANPNKKITSKLRIIDLAGSEKFIIPKELAADEKELHILELTSINQSLSTLGHCITALAESNRTHIPFRNSKLTRVLSDSLSGESKIIFIVCLSPSRESAQESFSTLQFASRAKKIILDGRQIRKKEEALRNNTRVLNKSNKVLELFKQLCADKTLINTMFDPSIINKINALENEVKQLKETNKELQDQVSDLKRSYSPDLSYLKNYSHSYSTPFEKEDRRCISTEPSPFYGEDENNHIFRKGINSHSTSGISTANKNPKYTEEDPEQENIYRGKDVRQQEKRVSNEDIRKMKEERANYLKFWSDTEPDTENSQDHSADRSSVMDIILGKQPSNLLAQKMKEKEIEKKYEMFFAMDSRQPSARSRVSDNSTQMPSSALGNITNIMNSQNNENISKYNREGLWADETGDSRILNKNNQAGNKLSDRDYVSGSRAYTSFNEQDGDNFYHKTEPTAEVIRTEATNYDSVGLDIIKEFDRKLLSVHQLNEQHQELIRNIGMKFQDWQQNRGTNKPRSTFNGSNRDENSQPVSMRSQSSPSKKLSKSSSGRDIRQVVDNIKQELSDALTQIEYLKKGEPDTSRLDTNVLTQQDTNVGSWADQTEDKSMMQSGRSMERYTWEDMKMKDDTKDKGIKRNENNNQKSGKSIGDILNRHWSTYKENIK